jgi:hypothetical protein
VRRFESCSCRPVKKFWRAGGGGGGVPIFRSQGSHPQATTCITACYMANFFYVASLLCDGVTVASVALCLARRSKSVASGLNFLRGRFLYLP